MGWFENEEHESYIPDMIGGFTSLLLSFAVRGESGIGLKIIGIEIDTVSATLTQATDWKITLRDGFQVSTAIAGGFLGAEAVTPFATLVGSTVGYLAMAVIGAVEAPAVILGTIVAGGLIAGGSYFGGNIGQSIGEITYDVIFGEPEFGFNGAGVESRSYGSGVILFTMAGDYFAETHVPELLHEGRHRD